MTYLSDRPDEPEDIPEVKELADMLYRILVNYEREGSGPGSRFEGMTLERVQARAAMRFVRERLP